MGDNIYLGDRNGVRTPMQWSPDRNAGFSRRQPAAALPAGHHRPRVPLRGAQRRGPAEQPAVAAVVDEAASEPAQAVPGLRPRQRWSSSTRTTPRCWPSCARTARSGSSWSRTCRGSSQHAELSLSVPARPGPRRDVRAQRRSPDRRGSLSGLPRAARLLLVRAGEDAAEPARRPRPRPARSLAEGEVDGRPGRRASPRPWVRTSRPSSPPCSSRAPGSGASRES